MFEKVVTEHGATCPCLPRRSVRQTQTTPGPRRSGRHARLPELLPADANVEEAWLVTIAYRKAIDLLRARRMPPWPTRTPRTASRRVWGIRE